MLNERPYMRNITPGYGSWSIITWIIVITSAAYVLENLGLSWFNSDAVLDIFGLSPAGLKMGFIWTPLTYALLHDPMVNGGIWHILFNIILIFTMGRPVEQEIGRQNTLVLYISSAILGALSWAAFHWSGQGLLIGASAGALGLLTVFCLLKADEYLTFLLFFIIPVTVKPKWILVATVAVEAMSFFFREIVRESGYDIASSAHLGGIAAGFIFYSFYNQADKTWWTRFFSKKSGIKKTLVPTGFTVNSPNHQKLKAQVDKILDKINQEGFGSLTPEEKSTLDKARDLLR